MDPVIQNALGEFCGQFEERHVCGLLKAKVDGARTFTTFVWSVIDCAPDECSCGQTPIRISEKMRSSVPRFDRRGKVVALLRITDRHAGRRARTEVY